MLVLAVLGISALGVVAVLAFTGDIADGRREDEYQIAGEWINDFCLSPAGLNLSTIGHSVFTEILRYRSPLGPRLPHLNVNS